MGLTDMLDRAAASWFGVDQQPTRSTFPSGFTFDQYVSWVTSQTTRFPTTTYGTIDQPAPVDFPSYVANAYASNGIVFAAAVARAAIFSEARFKFRRFVDGELFGGPQLSVLERFPGEASVDGFLNRMIGYADFGGNAWVVQSPEGLRLLRPDWTQPVIGSMHEPVDSEQAIPDGEVIGLVYHPGGYQRTKRGIVYLSGEFRHWKTADDPLSGWGGGMSWLTPIVREVMADNATNLHKLKFYENAATPNAVVTFGDALDPDAYDAWVDAFEKKKVGVRNAWRTVYLPAGTTLAGVGKDFQQADLKAVQGAGETRIAVAAGIPAVVLGISEGLAGSSLNAGNYTAARRRFADLTMRPLWRSACAALAPFVQVPAGSELWYDDRDIPFLQEDMKDAADIAQTQAIAVRNLVDAGFTADAAVLAVATGNLSALVGKHSGLFSVQLQAPGTVASSPTPDDPARSLALAVLARGDQREQVVIHNHQPPVTFEAGDVHVTPGAITVENRVEPSPVAVENHTTVAPTPVTVENHTTIEPTPVTVENRVDVAPASVTVTTPDTLHIASMPARETRRKVTKRTEKGGIAEAIDIEQDAEA